MKNIVLFLLLLTISVNSNAQQPYYDDVDLSLSGISLKNELASKIISTHSNTLSYSDVWEALKIVDLEIGSSTDVLLVYGYNDTDGDVTTDRTRYKHDNGGAVGDWNREHTYPKSLGTPNLGTSGPGADAHMLRASDVQRNGMRGSKKFKDASGNSRTVDSDYWYPGDEWKGDIARMMMYMYLRYDDRCYPNNVIVGGTVAVDSHMIATLLDWNAEDPVSQVEVNRNTYMGNTANAHAQGNRNPFIDNPYLATRIWGGVEAEDIWGIYIGVEENIIEATIKVYPNPTTDVLNIDADESILALVLYNLLGQEVISIAPEAKNTSLDLTDINAGTYFLKIDFENETRAIKVVKQ